MAFSNGMLTGKSALITGATSGIGEHIAKRFVEEGARVFVTGRERDRGQIIADSLGDRVQFVELDVTNEAAWQKALVAVVESEGQLDVLVNNAGVMTPASIESTTQDEFKNTIMTNAGGIFLGCKEAINIMKHQSTPGSIINVLSSTALKTSAWTLSYGASKAAGLSLTKSIALHCAEQKYDIRCNAVLPGVVMTPLVESLLSLSPDPEAALQELKAAHPVGRLIEKNEVADTVIFLASDLSSGVTGAQFSVDGGQTAA